MKFTSTVLAATALCAGAASAFGLPSVAKTGLKKAAPFVCRGGAVVQQSPLVQPFDITGKRLPVVSANRVLRITHETYVKMTLDLSKI